MKRYLIIYSKGQMMQLDSPSPSIDTEIQMGVVLSLIDTEKGTARFLVAQNQIQTAQITKFEVKKSPGKKKKEE